jgi:pimeloyl-ACP methyl ester carboxylesterase
VTPAPGAAAPEPRRRRLPIPGDGAPAELAALEFGDPARPVDVVFMHANGFNAMTYRRLLAPLATELHVLAIDAQGHGRSAQRIPADSLRSWRVYAEDLAGVLDGLAGPPPVLAGHSMGGAVGILTAAMRPERVRALALFDPVMLPRPLSERLAAPGAAPDRVGGAMAAATLRRRAVFASRDEAIDSYRGRGAFEGWSEAMLADYALDGFRERPDGQVELTCSPQWEAANFAALAHDPWAALERLRIPVEILRPEDQPTCALADPGELAPGPEVRITVAPGTNHFAPMQRPDLARRAISEAVRRG